MKRLKLFFACLLMAVLSIGQVWATDVEDVLTSAKFAATNTTYADFSGVTATSDAVYAGNSAKSSAGGIQLRSKNSNSGIVSTTSGGTVKSVSITVESGSNTIDIYGSNTAYTAASDLYNNSKQGTKVGSLSATGTVTFTDEYAYVGIRSNNGALYLTNVSITWGDGGSAPTPTLVLKQAGSAISVLNVVATDVTSPTIDLEYTNFGTITSVTSKLYSESTCETEITSGAWVTNVAPNAGFTQLSFDVEDNDDEAREVWLKVTASDGTNEASAVLNIKQAEYVAPATLPFAFTGGKDAIASTNGMTQNGLGSDYSGTANLKFDNTGDWLIINFNAAPNKLSYDIQGNSFSGGTFKVQESADGAVYEDVVTYTSLGSKSSKEDDLDQNTRYVKFVYTNKSSGNVGLGNIAISAYVAPSDVADPEIAGDESFYPSVEVSMSCATDGSTIYYTTDPTLGAGDPSSDTWTAYDNENKPSFSATTTIFAAAKKGDAWSNKVNKTFTKIEPLATMDEIFAAATEAGSTATDVTISFQNWVVSGAKGQTAYVTDGTKGFIIYYSGHGFNEGDILSGTGSFKLKLYNGAAEITAKNSGTITATTGGSAVLNVLDADGIAALTGINTGSLIKISGEATATDVVAGVKLYKTIYEAANLPALTATKNYNCTGVYVLYKTTTTTTNEIMPRTSADIEEIVSAGDPEFTPKTTKFVGSIDVTLSQENNQDIYYTDDETKKDAPSTTDWTLYENPIHLEATTTLYAAAWSGSEWSNVVFETYTKAEPLTTMAAVQAASTTTEAPIDVTITNWVVTAVDNITGDSKRVWIADADNTKGILLYASNYAHGFTVDKKLNGTVLDTKIKTFQGFAELTSLKASDVTVTDLEEAISARTTTIAALGTGRPAEQGTIVKLENVTYNGTNFSDGENSIYIDTRLYEPTLTDGKKYNLTGVVFYSSATSINLMPRSATDVEQLASKTLSSIELGGTYPTTFETGDAFSHEGMTVTAHYEDLSTETVTASATFSGYDMSAADIYEVTVSYTEGEITKTAKYNITVSDPAPTGDFEELDGELVAGDYIIYDDGSLMRAQIASNRFSYEAATPNAKGIISDPSRYAVWTLAKLGDYWTFYNAKTGKYAASTGASNKAQLLDDGTDDKALWSIDDELVVTNKYNAAQTSVNAVLRHNYTNTENYGFACYSANQGGKPIFYKQAIPSYYITETLTGCSAASNPAKIPQALTEDVVLHYNLSVGYAWPDDITVEVGGVALDPANAEYIWDTSVSPAELTIDYTLIDDDIEVTIVAQERTLTSISIAQAPTKTAYYVGDFFDPAGLQIQLNYSVGASETITYNDGTKDDFSFSPDLETELTVDDDNVVVTYATKTADQEISVTIPTPVEKKVVIIAEYNNHYYAMSNTVSSSACAAIEVTKDGGNLVAASDDDKAAIQWLMTTAGKNVTFQNANSKFLSSTASSGNLSVADAAVNWKVTEEGGDYLIAIGNTRALLYKTSGVFKHYATSNLTQNPDEYFKVSEIFEVAEGATNIIVDYGSYQRDVTNGNYGTICLPKAGVISGATLFEIADYANDMIYVDEITSGELAAGVPYIFQATSDQLNVTYTSSTIEEDAGSANGLYGFYNLENENAQFDIPEDNGNYILYQNQYWLVSGKPAYIVNYRAYIKLGQINNTGAQAPGRRRVAMPVNGANAPQGVDNIESGDQPVKKMIDGTLYIFRGERVYDATGRLVK